MFVLSNFLVALANILNMLLTILYWLILIRALLSWVNPDPYNFIVQLLYKTTEPILSPIRRRMGLFSIGIDLSPLIAILVIWFAKLFVVRSILDIAGRI